MILGNLLLLYFFWDSFRYEIRIWVILGAKTDYEITKCDMYTIESNPENIECKTRTMVTFAHNMIGYIQCLPPHINGTEIMIYFTKNETKYPRKNPRTYDKGFYAIDREKMNGIDCYCNSKTEFCMLEYDYWDNNNNNTKILQIVCIIFYFNFILWHSYEFREMLLSLRKFCYFVKFLLYEVYKLILCDLRDLYDWIKTSLNNLITKY